MAIDERDTARHALRAASGFTPPHVIGLVLALALLLLALPVGARAAGQLVSGIVRLGGDTGSPPYTQYTAALHALGLPLPPGTPTEGGQEPGAEGAAVFGLVAAAVLILIGVVIIVVFFRRQTS